MKKGYKNVREAVFKFPLLFINHSYPDKLVRYAESFIPYSTGIEIECRGLDASRYLKEHHEELYMNNPSFESDSEEVRVRLHPGLKGIEGLKVLCDTLQRHANINPKSGIHYHIDCSELGDYQDFARFCKKNEEVILSHLDTWGYKGKYNTREVGYPTWFEPWVKFQDGFKTLEFRIGEMSFDYKILIKRITSAQKLVRNIKHHYILHLKEKRAKEKDLELKEDYPDITPQQIVRLVNRLPHQGFCSSYL